MMGFLSQNNLCEAHHFQNIISPCFNAISKFPFPFKLHNLLDFVEDTGGKDQEIISWNNSGDAFCIFEREAFEEDLMPRFFGRIKYKSFHRQLNIYGFRRVKEESYYGDQEYWYFHHPCFVRGRRDLCLSMKRQQKVRAKSCKRKNLNLPAMFNIMQEDFYDNIFPDEQGVDKGSQSTKIAQRCTFSSKMEWHSEGRVGETQNEFRIGDVLFPSTCTKSDLSLSGNNNTRTELSDSHVFDILYHHVFGDSNSSLQLPSSLP